MYLGNPRLLTGVLLVLAGCFGEPGTPAKSPETLAVEATAGDFIDYYDEVLNLARTHAAEPDSFRAALDRLPGSHLTEQEWEAWTRPYRQEPDALADRLEKAIAEMSARP